MAEANVDQAEDKPRKKRKPKKGVPTLNNSQERRGSQESLLQKEEAQENPKLLRAKQRTKARFESLLQAAAEEGLAEESEKKKKKKRTMTADSILSELKSGGPYVKERSKSEERLLQDNIYTEGKTPKFKQKAASSKLEPGKKKENLDLAIGGEIDKENVEKVEKKPRKKGTKLKSKANENDVVDGKENVGYDYSPVKDERIETADLPKKKKKTKKQNTEPVAEVVERVLERKRRDDGFLLSIIIHKADRLKPDVNVLHPCVRVHVVDASTGQYVKKSDRKRNVASFFESSNDSVDYIMPLITQPFDFRKQRSMVPNWEEVLIYNEIFSYFLQREEGDPEVIIFFELLDFLSMSSVVRRTVQSAEQGWYKIAWAFLKVVSTNGSPNTDKKVRLQFYSPPSKVRTRNPITGALKIYSWWQSTERLSYPSTLYVTVKGIRPPDKIDAATRSMFPIQGERGTVTFEELSTELEGPRKSKAKTLDKKPIWNRLPGQANKIPNKLKLILPTGRKGCSLARFSPDGRYLACACAAAEGYPIFIYEIPSGALQGELSGHFGILYDMAWSLDGRELLTASSDGTARSWDASRFVSNAIKMYPHPSFVYTAKQHPSSQNIIVSGGYDKVVRVWSKQSDGLNAKVLREMTGHSGYVNIIIFNASGDQMFSGDSIGTICIWNCLLTNAKSQRRSKGVTDEDAIKSWKILQTLRLDEIKNTPINSLSMHPSGRKIVVHVRDAFIRMLDLRSSAVMKRYLGAVNQKEHIRSTISTCGTFVISGSEDGTVCVWNTETGDAVYEYSDLGYTSAVCDVNFHPHDNMIVFCSFGVGHPVLVYAFDIEEQMKSTKLNETAKDAGQTLKDAVGSIRQEAQNTANFPNSSNRTERDPTGLEKLPQKWDSILGSTLAGQTKLKQSSRGEHLSDTMMTWGSDFSTLLQSGSPLQKTAKYTASTPNIKSQFKSTRQSKSASHEDIFNIPGPDIVTPSKKYQSAFQTPIKGSPLSLSQLQDSRRPTVTFNADVSQRMPSRHKKVIVLYSYRANRSDELDIEPKDVITVLYEDNENWWFGELPDGRQGYFPANYVMDQEEELVEAGKVNSSHSAVISKDGNLQIISAPEDSETDARPFAAKKRQRRRKTDRSQDEART